VHSSFIRLQQMAAVAALLAAAALWSGATSAADDQSDKSLAQQIFETMLQAGAKPGFRLVHAKGVVCEGTFTASKDAATLSKAAHFQGASGPVTIRFSDGAPDPAIPDSSPNAGPRGMAIRFSLPGGGETDLVTMSHNGFAVSTGEDFLALQKAIVGREVVRAKARCAYIVYPDGVGRSKLTTALIEKKLGTRGTARNWNTVLKLGLLTESS